MELLQKIKSDKRNFSGLFNLYYQQIFGYIFRRTGNFDESADIAAETFLKAFTHIGNFYYNGISVKVWLYRIATNEVNMHFRNKQKNASRFERFKFENRNIFNDYLQEDREEMERELQKHEQFLAMLTALKTLPLKYQEVIALRYFEGKNNKEIAEILSLNQGTLKSLLSRGLEKLRERATKFTF